MGPFDDCDGGGANLRACLQLSCQVDWASNSDAGVGVGVALGAVAVGVGLALGAIAVGVGPTLGAIATRVVGESFVVAVTLGYIGELLSPPIWGSELPSSIVVVSSSGEGIFIST